MPSSFDPHEVNPGVRNLLASLRGLVPTLDRDDGVLAGAAALHPHAQEDLRTCRRQRGRDRT